MFVEETFACKWDVGFWLRTRELVFDRFSIVTLKFLPSHSLNSSFEHSNGHQERVGTKGERRESPDNTTENAIWNMDRWESSYPFSGVFGPKTAHFVMTVYLAGVELGTSSNMAIPLIRLDPWNNHP